MKRFLKSPSVKEAAFSDGFNPSAEAALLASSWAAEKRNGNTSTQLVYLLPI